MFGDTTPAPTAAEPRLEPEVEMLRAMDSLRVGLIRHLHIDERIVIEQDTVLFLADHVAQFLQRLEISVHRSVLEV